MESIDLDKDAWIEASAGTGKTYTIEQLVLSVLRARKVDSIDKILVVTFTEKATAELKERIRRKLEVEERQSQDLQDKRFFSELLDQFDSAAIYTIHGFCQRVLREYAFENQGLFEHEIQADSRALVREVMAERLRQWGSDYSLDAVPILTLLGYMNLNRDGDDSLLIQDIYRMLAHVRLGRNRQKHHTAPTLPQLPNQTFHETYSALRFGLEKFLQFIRPVAEASGPDEVPEFAACILRSTKNGWHATDMKSFARIRDAIRQFISRGGLWYESCELFQEIGDRFKIEKPAWFLQVEQALPVLGLQFQHSEAQKIQIRVQELKKSRGVIDFDDLLFLVLQAVESPGGPALCNHLSRLYPYVLVDEFQDTDAVQWEIFRKVFLNSRQASRLFLIGDPKQAIYSFRGADVFTYLRARHEVLSNGAQSITLRHNYRSTPEMIQVLNDTFTPLFPEFTRVMAPDKRADGLVSDQSGRKALTLVDLPGDKPSATAYPMAGFTAAEILRLIRGRTIIHRLDGRERSLNFGDICILIRKRQDSIPLQRELNRAGIPFVVYKEEGLYASAEAVDLECCLQALLAPQDLAKIRAAFMTPLFGMAPKDALQMTSLPPSHPLQKRFLYLQSLAQANRLPTLLKSLIEDSPVVNGPNWQRAYTNYRQMAEQMLLEHLTSHSSLSSLLRTLRMRRLEAVETERDQNLLRLPGEESRVQIMTIHVSKGLQFPVVFVAGGYSKGKPRRSGVCHPQGPDGLHYSAYLSNKPDHEAHALLQTEEEQENLRLLYVALTRTRYKLYLPLFCGNLRYAGPVYTLLGPSIGKLLAENHPNLESVQPEPAAINPWVTDEEENLPPAYDPFLQGPDPDLWLTEDTIALPYRRIQRVSFSSLMRQDTHRMSDEPALVAQQIAQEDSSLLPRGAEFGSLVHRIMELLDFENSEETPTLLNEQGFSEILFEFGFSQEILPELLTMIHATLKLSIPEVGPGFSLLRLANRDTLRECEFWFDSSQMQKYCYGAQDFVFRHQGKVYLLDWKTNWLEKYDEESLRACMDSSGYFLQAAIYAVCIKRWLAFRLGSPESFGGVIYLFTRGAAMGQGCLFLSPEDSQLLHAMDGLEERIAKA